MSYPDDRRITITDELAHWGGRSPEIQIDLYDDGSMNLDMNGVCASISKEDRDRLVAFFSEEATEDRHTLILTNVMSDLKQEEFDALLSALEGDVKDLEAATGQTMTEILETSSGRPMPSQFDSDAEFNEAIINYAADNGLTVGFSYEGEDDIGPRYRRFDPEYIEDGRFFGTDPEDDGQFKGPRLDRIQGFVLTD